MGNLIGSNNIDLPQHGNGIVNNFEELQNRIQNMVKNQQSTANDTLGLNSSSIDFESVNNMIQNGGYDDFLRVKPRRGVDGTNNARETLEKMFEAFVRDYKTMDAETIRVMNGGCGCAAEQDSEPTNLTLDSAAPSVLSSTSPQPVNYATLVGGKDADEDDEDVEGDEEIDDDIDIEDDGDDDNVEVDNDITDDVEDADTELVDDDDEDNDRNDEEDDDDIDSDKIRKEKKERKALNKVNNAYLNTSEQDGGSEEIIIDSKYLYSDNNTFYGSDDNSEYYKTIKNKSFRN